MAADGQAGFTDDVVHGGGVNNPGGRNKAIGSGKDLTATDAASWRARFLGT